ncbi:MAG: acetyl-CoA decarbonylase/synthase complex subunit gamma [Omnitrophica WOR_2 bacterium SM23_72]|nr:MAG: acetyl-CoA decarbonylase/synthase complex subunit gamma [Omnitrophica WOR_2 bacterium SM23_72]
MALSGLDIYKLLPKTNCRECGFATCLAFAMQLAKKAVTIDKCPYLSEEAKKVLEASSQAPIKLISVGTQEGRFEIGNETVMFRHEEKFHRPCGIGFIVDDSLSDNQIKERVAKIHKLKFERVGQELTVNLIAVRQCQGADRFAQAVDLVSKNTSLALTLMCRDAESLKKSLGIVAAKKPLVYRATKENLAEFAALAKEYKVPLVAEANNLQDLGELTKALTREGIQDLILDTGLKPISEKIWDLTQIRRQSLKSSNRSLGYPVLAITQKQDPFEEAQEAATYIAKYAGIILMDGLETWQVLSLLTLRQNIYTDPQKPLQIEPKLYPIGVVSPQAPVLVTTNFSLTYYTVLGEVEASKVPAYIVTIDTEGMSVLTAWAAEKLTPEKISASLANCGIKDSVSHQSLVIPGYVAVMSGDLEEQSGWKVIVGPKEASGIPSFLKNLHF